MRAVLDHVRRNTVAYIALFVALGGTGYAATELRPGSVGPSQIKNHAITPVKFNRGAIGAVVRYWAIIGPGGHLIASRPSGARVSWDSSDDTGIVSWARPLESSCFPLAAGDDGFVRVLLAPRTNSHAFVQWQTYTAAGQPDPNERADIAVVCPT